MKDSVEVFSLAEVAEILKISDRTAFKLVKDGKLERVDGIHKIRVSKENLLKFIRNKSE